MKFLFLSNAGDGLGLALRLKQNGHNVAAWIRDKRAKQDYDGLLAKVQKWENFLDKSTIVVFDSTGGGKTGDRLRARGHYVFGGSAYADQLELDRGTAFELLRQVGVKVPKTETFYDWEEGRRYAKKFEGRLVFKPSGELAKQDDITTYVAYDAQDMIDMLEYFESICTKTVEFELQQFVEDGVAISSEGWFNGREFMRPWNHTLENKATYNDNLGPSCGCMFDVVWKTEMDHIIEEGIAKVEPLLQEQNYVGLVDLNTVVNHQGVWALEFTPRFGYDSFPTTLELWKGDIGETIAQMAMLEHPKQLPLQGGFGSALRLMVPPAPNDEMPYKGGVPIRGWERSDREHLFFYGIKLNESDKLVTTPGYAYVAAITGYGNTIPEAFEEPYVLAKKALIPEKMYRTDAVKEMMKDYHKFEVLVEAKKLGHEPVEVE